MGRLTRSEQRSRDNKGKTFNSSRSTLEDGRYDRLNKFVPLGKRANRKDINDVKEREMEMENG